MFQFGKVLVFFLQDEGAAKIIINIKLTVYRAFNVATVLHVFATDATFPFFVVSLEAFRFIPDD